MSKLGSRLLAALGVAQAVAAGAALVNLSVDTADGKKLKIETTGDTYVVGDAVTYDDDSAVPDGDYILSDGNTITVEAGVIKAIAEPTTTDDTATTDTSATQVDGETVTISKAEHDRLMAVDGQVTSLTNTVGEHTKFMARLKPVLDQMAQTESASPVVANRLPETPVDKRVPATAEDDAVARKKARVEARKG